MEYAAFYVLSVGPGDPELITLKAKHLLEQCPVIAAPETADGNAIALDIAGQAVCLKDKAILRLRFSMSRDEEVQSRLHTEAADRIERELAAGQAVAMPVLGDASIYASSGYITDILKARGIPVEIVPGVPSFCAAAAARRESLCRGPEELHILPGYIDCSELLKLRGTKVVMKLGRRLPDYLQKLKESGLLEKTEISENCGMEGERTCSASEWTGEEMGYFTTLTIKE